MNKSDDVFGAVVLLLAMLLAAHWLNKRKTNSTAQGSAYWMTEQLLRAWWLLTGQGLVVCRSGAGSLITVRDYTHTLVIGGTGSGKGVGFVIPNLLTYRSGSMVVFDTKGDLKRETAARRQQFGDRIIDLRSQGDCLNPLDLLPADSPTLFEDAAVLAAGLVVSEPGEKEPHWNERAMVILTGLLVYVLKTGLPADRNLNTVQYLLSKAQRLKTVGGKLTEAGGICQRFGGHIESLFEKELTFTREGSSVLAVLSRHLSFLDSESVGRCVSKTTFDPYSLLRPGMTVYMHIPPHRLDAQKNLLRMWVSTFAWVVGSSGSEVKAETFFMLDEAGALGGLPGVHEMLVRGRSAGARAALIYQSEDQVKSAFAQMPTIIPDNCATQIFIGGPTSIESAKRRSEMVGDTTLEVVNSSTSHGSSDGPAAQGASYNRGGGTSTQLMKRALLDPAEMLKIGSDSVMVFHRGLPALILGRRIEYYRDPAFIAGRAATQRKPRAPWRRRIPLKWRWIIGITIWLALMLAVRASNQAKYQEVRTWPTSSPKK